jgi:DeoR family suf operon transcriptional repressor
MTADPGMTAVGAAFVERAESDVDPGGSHEPMAPTETAGDNVRLEAFSEAAQRVLQQLKRGGEATADQLASEAGVTVSAIRQVVRPLEEVGLLAHRDERSAAPGRPRRWYCLAPAAESLWPKRYGQLTNQLLGFIDEAGADLVEEAFARRGAQRVAAAHARLEGRRFDERVRELALILDEDGYLADCRRTDEGWLITEHNCAILDVALRYGAACRSEIAFLRAVLPEARVERISHMIAGAHVCAYEIVPAA